MSTLLFGQPHKGARHAWNASDFVNVDDTVRGGSSSSSMTVVRSDEKAEQTDQDSGAIDFAGFLDTTTLGGAGFASQAYSNPLPGQKIDNHTFHGLRLVGRRLPIESMAYANDTYAGGGKGPVTSYVVNLKTEKPAKRPDGRRESQIVYEWQVNIGKVAQNGIFDVSSAWTDFHPTYRGRPAPDAPPLDPSNVQEWSIMARSDFGSQSGPFCIRLISLSAISTADEKLQVRSSESQQSYVVAMDNSTSSEYYGFALFILATVVMVIWIVWAITPDSVLHRLGIEWYPNREWAFLLPAWSLLCVLFIYAAFITLNIHNNAPLDDVSNIVDSHSNLLPLPSKGTRHPLQDRSVAQTGGLDGPMADDVYDLPPGLISRERHGL